MNKLNCGIQGGLGLVIESNDRVMWSKLPNAELVGPHDI